MQQPLSALLFPGYRRSILGLLLLNADQSLHGREIARRISLPSGSVIRELNRLAEAGLLDRERRGNQTLYRANRKNPIFEEIASILRKTSGIADVLKGALQALAPEIRIAFIFGSVARGAETSGSDIDLLVIGAVDFGAVIDALYPAQQALGREINPKVFSTREWNAQLKDKNPFILDLLERSKLFLIGDKDDLKKLGRKKS